MLWEMHKITFNDHLNLERKAQNTAFISYLKQQPEYCYNKPKVIFGSKQGFTILFLLCCTSNRVQYQQHNDNLVVQTGDIVTLKEIIQII